jgi:hypothetical protein
MLEPSIAGPRLGDKTATLRYIYRHLWHRVEVIITKESIGLEPANTLLHLMVAETVVGNYRAWPKRKISNEYHDYS